MQHLDLNKSKWLKCCLVIVNLIITITNKLCLCRGGMIQTGEQYEFVHHALSLYEARLSAETGQWACTAAGGVDWNLEVG